MGQRRRLNLLGGSCLAAAVLATTTVHAADHPSFRGRGLQQNQQPQQNQQQSREAGVWYGPDAMLSSIDLLLEDKRAAVEYDVAADASVRPGTTYPNCQWHVKFAFNYTSQGLIDPNAVYYAELLSGPMTGRAYKIKGRFPPSIYFSWQLYNSLFTGEAAQRITDFNLQPHWGKNPFTDGSATPFDTGGYELYLTPSGTEGYPNELRLPRGMTNTLILRMYKPDPSLGEGFPVEQIDPPVLYVGQTTNDGKREWRALPPCSHDQEILADRAATAFYQVNYPQNSGTLGRGVVLRDYNCPMNPEKGNVSFVLFEGSWLTPELRNLVARQSSDSPYLFYCINPNNRWEHFLNTVFKFRFKMPKIPDGLYEPIKVANVGDYDLRYLSIMTAESVLPQPTIQAIDGAGIKRFYAQQHHASPDWDGWVEVRVALNEQKAKECGFWDPTAVFLPLASDRVGPSKSITLVIRSVLAHGLKTAGAASRACNKTADCGKPAFIRNIMQEHYPELEVYHCEGGKLNRYPDYWANNH